MKTLLFATLTLSSCACYAHVRAGPNNTYTVDNYGTPINGSDAKPRLPPKVKFMPEAEARHADSFKSNLPLALF